MGDFNESCFHMTRQLISNSAWASFGVSEITNAVIDQVAVGTVIKVDEAITGFITALNINNKNILKYFDRVLEIKSKNLLELS